MTAAPPPPPAPGPSPYGYPAAPDGPKPGTSGMAIAAMILGIVAIPAMLFICLGLPLAITGLVLGIIATIQIGKPGKPAGGRGMAITGIVLSGLSLAVIPVGIGIMAGGMGGARNAARKVQAQAQVRALQQALLVHAAGQPKDASGNRPATDDLGVLVVEGTAKIDDVVSPFDDTDPPNAFATMSDAARADWVRYNASYVLVPGLTDAPDAGKIAVFGIPDRFKGGIPVAYGDGSADWIDDDDLDQFRRDLRRQTGKPLDDLIRDARSGP